MEGYAIDATIKERENPRVKGLVEMDSGIPRQLQASTNVAFANDMSASIADATSPCRRSGMPRCVAMPATIQRRRGAPILAGSVKSCCRRRRNRPGVMSVGKGGAQRVVDEAGLEASPPKLPLCIWCGAAPDDGPSSDAG